MTVGAAPVPGTPLPPPLVAWLVEQRWFGDRGRPVRGAAVVTAEAVADDVVWALVDVAFEDATVATYQLFLPLPLGSGTDVADRPEAVRWLFPELLGHEALGAAPGRVRLLGGEQSNTSLVVATPGGEVIVKLFRRVGTEPNPDVEAVRRLWEVGYRRVPEPLAESRRADRDLAVARRFLPGSTSGWELAVGEEGLAADGSEFPPHAGELGRVTAELHLALAAAFGSFDPDPARWADDMRRQLERVDLGEERDAVADRYDAFAALDPAQGGRAVRIHGDYHLGQVLHWEGGWYVLDFEGEPARPIAERTAPSSPLRDVAGMLRSFGYAAAVGNRPPTWEQAVRDAFVEGYLATPGIDTLLPVDHRAVLQAFELDKAVYEVAYERAHRPDWVAIPQSAVERLLR